MERNKALGILALFGATLCFSGNYMLGGAAASSMPLSSLMYIKWGASAIPLLIFAHYTERPDWRQVLRHWKKIASLSFFGIAGYSFMLYQSLKVGSPIQSALINAFDPALTAFLAMVFLGEKLSLSRGLGIFVAFLGVIWVMTKGNPLIIFDHPLDTGSLWMVGVVASWTCYVMIYRTGAQIPAMASCSLQMIFFTLVMTPYIIINGISVPESKAGLYSLAYIAIFPSAIAYTLWNYGAKKLSAAQAAQFSNIYLPCVALLTLLSGNSITFVQLSGGIVILFGVYLSLRETQAKVRVHELKVNVKSE